MPKPVVRKTGNTWRVHIGPRVFATYKHHYQAMERAHGIATHARRTQARHALQRAAEAYQRMESNR